MSGPFDSWADVGKLIAPLGPVLGAAAPMLGDVLGDLIPIPGAGLVGHALGQMIATSLGVPATPQAVGAALQSTPNDMVIAKLKAVADEARAQWPAWAQVEAAYAHLAEVQIMQVNTTMRAEILSASVWDKWRAACGWVLAYFAFGIVTLVLAAIVVVLQGDEKPLKSIADAWPLLAALFGILACIVGVKVWAPDRSAMPGTTTDKVAVPGAAQPVKKP